ncbi:MAG: Gfo/Idh/MocA family oxidoreductase [Candidatus Methanomethylicaceae archaeon]
MIKKVLLGIIGCGFMGSLHAKVLSTIPLCKIVAVQDVNENRAKSLAKMLKADYYKDIRSLLKRKDLDAVIISTPDHLHKDPAVISAEEGKHILLEKPIATSIEDAKAIIDAAKKHNVKLMVGHILRFDSRYYSIKTAIEEGNIGKPIMLYARRNAPITEARRLQGRVHVALYLAIHDVDLALWYIKDEVSHVFAEDLYGKVYEEMQTPDFNFMLISFRGGTLASIECGWGLSENWSKWVTPKKWRGFGDVQMEVIGTEGSIYLNYHPMCLYACDSEGWKFPDTLHWPIVHDEVSGSLLNQDLHFLKCILEDKIPLVRGEDGLAALKVVLAAIQSASKREKIVF